MKNKKLKQQRNNTMWQIITMSKKLCKMGFFKIKKIIYPQSTSELHNEWSSKYIPANQKVISGLLKVRDNKLYNNKKAGKKKKN